MIFSHFYNCFFTEHPRVTASTNIFQISADRLQLLNFMVIRAAFQRFS